MSFRFASVVVTSYLKLNDMIDGDVDSWECFKSRIEFELAP